MIVINHAVLHIFNLNSGVAVFSDEKLKVENSIETFLLNHIEKSFKSPKVQQGTFMKNSICKDIIESYLKNDIDFISFSKKIANLLYTQLTNCDKAEVIDFVVCDLTIDSKRLIAFLKCNNKPGFVHQVVKNDELIKNDINHYAIMPSTKVSEFAFIDEDLSIKFTDKKYSMNEEKVFLFAERFLNCVFKLSDKDCLNVIKKVATKVAEENSENSIQAVIKAKKFIYDNAITEDSLNLEKLGQEVFENSHILQEEYMDEMQALGLDEEITIQKELALKNKNHKIKTDTGIELTIPIDYFDNEDYVEINNAPDGTIEIKLKNIAKLINK